MSQGNGAFLLRTEVAQGIMETAKFGDQFLTYLRLKDSDRVAALDRYPDERAAREGHAKWTQKDWSSSTLADLLLKDA